MTFKRGITSIYPLCKGILEIFVLDLDGNLLQYIKGENLVVDTGRQMAAEAIGTSVNRIGIGTNGAPAEPTDRAPLTEQYDKGCESVEYPTQRSVKFNFLFTSDEYNGKTIREFGLLSLKDGTYTLFARKGGFDIAKTDQIQIQGSWTITF
jgi:hypothetical protein